MSNKKFAIVMCLIIAIFLVIVGIIQMPIWDRNIPDYTKQIESMQTQLNQMQSKLNSIYNSSWDIEQTVLGTHIYLIEHEIECSK